MHTSIYVVFSFSYTYSKHDKYSPLTFSLNPFAFKYSNIFLYALGIYSNALANEKHGLYKAIKATFTTEKGVLECNATGDGNSAEFAFSNAGESKNVVLVATVWDGDKYVGKVTEPYQIATGDSTYTFNYASVTGGDRAEVTVWEYADGKVNAVYGKKVFTFER